MEQFLDNGIVFLFVLYGIYAIRMFRARARPYVYARLRRRHHKGRRISNVFLLNFINPSARIFDNSLDIALLSTHMYLANSSLS